MQPRKIALPEGMEAQEPFAIQKHHLDTHHLINIASISAWGRLSARRLCDPTDEGRI